MYSRKQDSGAKAIDGHSCKGAMTMIQQEIIPEYSATLGYVCTVRMI